MKILVLGGTRFVGRHVVEAALASGHTVTLFNRGISAPDLFPDVETLKGDRGGDHAALAGRSWDAVIDASAYRPDEVRAAAASLKGRAGLYAFISTVSVYKRFENGGDEDAETVETDPDEAKPASESYGSRKRACELVLEREWGAPFLIVRPCVVAGPYDDTDRFTYWPVRLSRGGRVLAPGSPDKPAQLVDGRDLGAWLAASAAAGLTGTYNVVGPALPFGELLGACEKAAELVWADDEFLLASKVRPRPYQDLPFWIPGPVRGFIAKKALAAGFKTRPLATTAADVLTWHRERGEPELKAGLSPELERRLLAELEDARRSRPGHSA